MPEPTAIPLTIDGRAIEALPGEVVISAAERHGIYIPRFCYHPRMKPVGMCRMCLVDVVGPRGTTLQAACFMPATEGMVVQTQNTSPAAAKAQEDVLEFLLINHPLDCPVCDKGGECPLQDQTMAHGPGETRMVEEKRHWEKPIELSDLVLLDRERCIQCARCTRFADEIAGDPQIGFLERSGHTEVGIFPGQPFDSYFSGNTIQICPVGALTAAPYRFRARPWDLEQVEATCTSCAVGCRMAVQSSSNRLTRNLGLDNEAVNHGWLCDRGRFGYEAVNADARLAVPLLRRGDDLVASTWSDTLAAAADALGEAVKLHGPSSVGIIGGARLTNEDAYAWAKLAKGVLGTDSVDAQLGDGLPAELVLGLPRATIAETTRASAIVLLAPDVKEELPVLYLRLRSAAVEGDVPIVEIAPHGTGLSRYATTSLRYRPGEAGAVAKALVESGNEDAGGVAAADIAAARAVLGADPVVVLGRPSVAESAAGIVDAAAALARLPGVRFLSALRRANVHGALDMGLAPGILPGRVSLDDGREWFSALWPSVPAARGLDTQAMLTEAAEGRLRVLVLLGADPLADFPDRELARRGLSGAGFVIAVDCLPTESARHADVVLPAATFAERGGSTTNLEGRISRMGQKITPPGLAWPDWMIASELATRLGAELAFNSVGAIWDEIERVAPSHRGITRALVWSPMHSDGIVAPMEAEPEPTLLRLGDVNEGEILLEDPPVAETEPPDVAAADLPEPHLERPVSLVFSPPEKGAAPPAPDSYSLRLVASRWLYDDGTGIVHSPALSGLRRPFVLRANPYDLERLGIMSSGRVRLTSRRGTLLVDALADVSVPKGSAFLPFNLGTPGAADLIDSSASVTDVRVETP